MSGTLGPICTAPFPTRYKLTLQYRWSFRNVPQAALSWRYLQIDHIDLALDTLQRIQVLEVHRDRLIYELECSKNSMVKSFQLAFLLVDIPGEIEIGFIYVQSHLERQRVSFRRTFSSVPKLAVFENMYVPRTATQIEILNSIDNIAVEERGFTF